MIATAPTDDIIPPAPGDASLAEILSVRARRASTRRLTINIVAGLIAVGAFYWFRPKGWAILVAAAMCFVAYGAWGFADRQVPKTLLVVPQGMHAFWRVARGIAAVIGVMSFATALVVFLGFALGTMQS